MNRTVLSVDDSMDDTLLLQRACHRAGVRFKLQAVDDGTKAIAYLQGLEGYSDRTNHPFPNMVLLDLKMPLKTGFEVLDWLRAQADFSNLPVAVFTASQHEADVREAYRKGANYFLIKPIEYEELVLMAQTLDQALENQHTSTEGLRSLRSYRPAPDRL